MVLRPNQKKNEGPRIPVDGGQSPGLSIRLAQLVGYVPSKNKRLGTIKKIAQYTGIDRHIVSQLLHNQADSISFDNLRRLMEYLIEHEGIPAGTLPGALFGVAPDKFWGLLSYRRHVELCLGVRAPDETEWYDGALSNANDTLLESRLLLAISTVGGASKFSVQTAPPPSDGVPTSQHQAAEKAAAAGDTDAAGSVRSRPEVFKKTHVWSPRRGSTTVDSDFAMEKFQQFMDLKSDKALVNLGSPKSNPVAELTIASAFHCSPFKSQDDLSGASHRNVPFFFLYRKDDPRPPSCCCGERLSPNEAAEQPGIYYELPNGKWACSPWDPEKSDAGLVFYNHREGSGLAEVVIGGFSGRASRLLGQTLANQASAFWPPTFDEQGEQIGAFIVEYSFPKGDNKHRDILRTELDVKTEIIPLDYEVLARRLK